MSCVIRLSEPLLKLRSRKELVETLLHEMIHAWNFIRGIREENGGHGPQFLGKMTEINQLAGTNITVYHTFHDEVELYKTHWWRCDGPCKDRKPFFGYVKRTSNRAPSKNDLWWEKHQSTCGGTFIKVKEPEKKARKKAEPRKTASKAVTKKLPETPKREDIRKFFSPSVSPAAGSSATSDDSDSSFNASTFTDSTKKKQPAAEIANKVGGSGSGRSRLLDMFGDHSNAGKKRKHDADFSTISLITPPPKKNPAIAAKPPTKSIISMIRDEFDDEDDDIIFIDDEFDDSIAMPPPPVSDHQVKIEPGTSKDFCNCPICNARVEADSINQHLDECLTFQFLK
jgi:predicted SprT family Zn-dependent metalloprotease